MIVGTILHIIVGLLIHKLTKWTASTISALFLFKEVGEAKYQLPGSIWSIEKTLKMFGHIFEPTVAAQWILPGLAVYVAILLNRKYGRNPAVKK